MKNKSFLITLFVLAAGLLSGAEKPQFRVYMVPRIADTVDASGMTSPAIWKGIPKSSDFGLFPFGHKGQPREKTGFRAAYNRSGIFLQIHCSEKLTPQLDFSKQTVARDSSGVFSKPVAEVFLDPGFTRKSAAQIVVNINGGIYDQLGDNAAWNYPVKTEIVPDTDGKGYVFYLMLPWVEISYENPDQYQLFSMTAAVNPVIGFNIGREQVVGGGDMSQWNPTMVKFMRPDHFGALVLSAESDAKAKMLALFTDEVVAGGIDIQGANQASEAILRDLLRIKLENGENLITSLPEQDKKNYGNIYAAIRRQFLKAKTQKELGQLLSECVQTNNKLEKSAFNAMKQQILNEI